jgi:hypothetical protein
MSAIDRQRIREVEDKADYAYDNPSAETIKSKIKTGDRVAYIGSDNLYRSGGFIVRIADDGNSITIKGGPYTWTLQRRNIKTIFITSKK